MNIQKLHTFVTLAFDNVRPVLDPIFDDAIEKSIRDGRSVNLATFIKKLNKVLALSKIKIVLSDGMDSPDKEGRHYPGMLGFCEPPTRTYWPAKIEIWLCTAPKNNRLSLSKAAWGNFQFRLYQTILHELVHKAQFAHGMKRKAGLVFKPHAAARINKTQLLEQQYLGEIDEIESYARDCVEDWYYQNPDVPLTIRKIKKEFRKNSKKLYTVRYYDEAYKSDLDHPALVRLFRKIAQWNKLIKPLSGSLMPCPTYVLFAPNITTPVSAQQ